MILTYLGTAASEGWPAFFCRCPICREAQKRGGKDFRNRACAIVDEDLLLDISPDIYAARKHQNVDLTRIKNVLFTHSHKDHFNPELLRWYAPNFAAENDRTPLMLYGSEGVKAVFDRLNDIWRSHYSDGWFSFCALEEFKRTQIDENTFVTMFPAIHSIDDACIYLIERNGRKLFYMHDSCMLKEEVLKALEGENIDCFSIDATRGVIKTPENVNAHHMGFDAVLKMRRIFIERKIGREDSRYIANHICIHSCTDESGKMYFHEDMEKLLHGTGAFPSFDGMKVQI
ncbi:MAG: hypothetical protein IKJ65_00580 [Clostridia bacterium]|nr:hypothetical protein [Clostridia bacterium]